MRDQPLLIDLYAGVGGLSLGAARAGFDLAAAIDNDLLALKTHALNFPASQHGCGDVSKLSGKRILSEFGLKRGSVSGVIGGPPCQGFSSMGRQDPNDPRSALFMHFFRLVDELRPAFFVAENVPNILADKFSSVVDSALGVLRDTYEILDPITVCASSLGAPTRRQRVFFVGYDPEKLAGSPSPEEFLQSALPSVTVKTGLRGLPSDVSPDWQSFESGCRRARVLPSSEFYDRIVDHVPPGVGAEWARKLLERDRIVTGCLGTRHAPRVLERFARLRPGEIDRVSKAARLHPNGFCPTIRAGTGKDRGSYQSLRPIHHSRPRVITPREAARLQGFPDWFLFHPTKWHSFRQIGNSVSPIVAECVLRPLRRRVR